MYYYPEDRGSRFMRNVDKYLPDDTASHAKGQDASLFTAVGTSKFIRP
jgi:hypothetical protein